MKEINIAFRNLNRQKKRSILLAGAIAFGILFVTIINSFTGSFVKNVGENFSHIMAGHIFIEGKELLESGRRLTIVKDDRQITDLIDRLGIDYEIISKRTSFSGNLIFEGKSINQTIVGADWKDEGIFETRIVLREGSFEKTEAEPRGIIISEDVADILGASLGDKISVRLRNERGQFNSGYFFITGISADPGFVGTIASLAHLDYVNTLLGRERNDYMTMGIYLPQMKNVDEYADLLYAAMEKEFNLFPRIETTGEETTRFQAMLDEEEKKEPETWEGVRYRITTINETLNEVQDIVDVLNTAGLIILLILFVIIMVGITNTFRIVMYERIREIGTIRALGMQRDNVRNLFLFEAFFIAMLGILSGLTLAGIIMLVLSLINFGMDTPFFILMENGHLTFIVQPLQFAINILVVFGLTLLAAFIPARKAALLDPAVALRTQK